MAAVMLADAGVRELRQAVRGELLRPGDTEYDAARTIHNGLIDPSPAVIVRCAGVADVITALRFANERELLRTGADQPPLALYLHR